MDKNKSIYINQTLHGYKNGHTLLMSSGDLPSEIKRLMLPISDMSGASIQTGFESYLTGYALKELNVYALARTWYASEMKRPGCVWTHTLLIDFGDIPKINNIPLLLSLFKRPEISSKDFISYEKKIHISELDIYNESFDNPIEDDQIIVTKSILYNLYQNTNKILIPTKNPKEFEKLFLLIWRQQWPRLRRNFSFCTGAIMPRNFEGELLDLQAVSNKLDSSYASNKNVKIIEEHLTNQDYKSAKWADLAFENILFPSPKLTDFFNFFGSDLVARRTSFKSLAETYIFFQEREPDLPTCIKYLTNIFPEKLDAINLKNAIFNQEVSQLNFFLPYYNEAEIIYHFTITKYYKSFDYNKLNYQERFLNLFKLITEGSIQFLNQLIKQDLNNYGESALINLAKSLEKNNKLKLIWKDKNLSYIFITLNPRLTYDKNFWIENITNQAEIINNLQKNNDTEIINWQFIINILIETSSTIDLRIFDRNNLDIESLILNWIDKNENVNITDNWLHYLHSNPLGSIRWLNLQNKPKARSIETLVRVLNPNSKIVIECGIKPWVNYIFTLKQINKQYASIEAYCFFITLALNSKNNDAQKLFEISFEPIYHKLASDSLNYYWWNFIEVHTKPLSLFKNWDKCKKFINAVVDHYSKNSWSINSLIIVLENRELKDRVLTQYQRRK